VFFSKTVQPSNLRNHGISRDSLFGSQSALPCLGSGPAFRSISAPAAFSQKRRIIYGAEDAAPIGAGDDELSHSGQGKSNK